jgi:hypothetical protein
LIVAASILQQGVKMRNAVLKFTSRMPANVFSWLAVAASMPTISINYLLCMWRFFAAKMIRLAGALLQVT